MVNDENVMSIYEEVLRFEVPNVNYMTARKYAFLMLQEAIVRNRLKPGTWLSEEHLSNVLNISRTPVREALLELHSNKLIERGDNGRLYVKRLTVKEALDLYAVREALEELVITQAAQNLKEIDLVQLKIELENMRRADEGSVREDVGDRGRKFHELLYSIADNEVTMDLLQKLQPRFDRYRYVSTSTGKKRTTKAIEEHELIYEALSRRDVNKARELMRKHIQNSKQTVIQALQNITDLEGG